MLLVMGGGAYADEIQQQVPADEKLGFLVKQKLQILDGLLDSGKIRQLRETDNVEAKERLAKALILRDEARKSMAEGHFPEADRALDASLRVTTSVASSIKSQPVLDSKLQQTKNIELEQQIRTYISAISETLKVRKDIGQEARLSKLIDMLVQANKQTLSGKHDVANQILTDGYKLAVTTLSELRAGETIVLELKFNTPADEYRYELQRNHSHQMLVQMVKQEGKNENAGSTFEQFVQASRELHSNAESRAESGDYAAAIKLLESATRELVKALQLTGMAIF